MNTTTTTLDGFQALSWTNRIAHLEIGYSLVAAIFFVPDLPLSMLAVFPIAGSYLALSGITGIGFITFQMHQNKSLVPETRITPLEEAILSGK